MSGIKEAIRSWRADDADRAMPDVRMMVLHRDDAKHRWVLVDHETDPLGKIVAWHATFFTLAAAKAGSSAIATALGKRVMCAEDWERDDASILEVWAT